MERKFKYLGVGTVEKPENFTGVSLIIEDATYYFWAKPHNIVKAFFVDIDTSNQVGYFPNPPRMDLTQNFGSIYTLGSDEPVLILDNQEKRKRMYYNARGHLSEAAYSSFGFFWVSILDSLSKYQNVEMLFDDANATALRFYNLDQVKERIIVFLNYTPFIEIVEGYFDSKIVYQPDKNIIYGIDDFGIDRKNVKKSVIPESKLKELMIKQNLKNKGNEYIQ